MKNELNDTIVAVATSASQQAISIIKLSGDDSINIVSKIFSKDLTNKQSHTLTYGYIIEDNDEVDEVLVSIFKAPNTFTKENIVEINCHGGVYVTRKILSLCLANGARIANNGEFSKRAFLNGRIDLTQAEAISDIISAKNETNLKLSMNSLKGSIFKIINPLITNLLDIIAQIEVNIDYPEYDDVEQLKNDVLKPMIINWLKDLDKILEKANNTRFIKEGIDTAIIGKPNVGKSSLLNALLEEEKAIVTEIPGTTRDLVTASINIEHITLNLIDTAGIRETADIVEKIGIQRSVDAISKAELIILVFNAKEELDQEDKKLLELVKEKEHIIVYNKADLVKVNNQINISALNQEIDELKIAILSKYDNYRAVIDDASLNNERQIGCLMSARMEILEALESLNNDLEVDLITINLQEAYFCLKDILGERNKVDLIDTLFSKFCLGK